MLGVWVQSLAKELRSHILHSQKKKNKKKKQNIKQKQYCNKFNKDFKNDPHQKKKKNDKATLKKKVKEWARDHT